MHTCLTGARVYDLNPLQETGIAFRTSRQSSQTAATQLKKTLGGMKKLVIFERKWRMKVNDVIKMWRYCWSSRGQPFAGPPLYSRPLRQSGWPLREWRGLADCFLTRWWKRIRARLVPPSSGRPEQQARPNELLEWGSLGGKKKK